jgi:hypothetical protein
MSNSQPTWDFNLYDPGFARHAPDTSTAARSSAVAFEVRVRRELIEHGAFFRSDGSLIFEKIGLKKSIPLSPLDLVGTEKSLFTHNHPDGSSFSIRDVETAIQQELCELRVVAPDWRHIMRPYRNQHWPSRPAIISAVRNETYKACTEVHGMMNSGQLSYQHKDVELQHQIWHRVAHQLKFEYIREAS